MNLEEQYSYPGANDHCDWQARALAAEARVAELEEQLERTTAGLAAKAADEIEVRDRWIAELEAEAERLREWNRSLQDERDRIVEKLTEATGELVRVRCENDRLQAEVASAIREREEAKAECEALLGASEIGATNECLRCERYTTLVNDRLTREATEHFVTLRQAAGRIAELESDLSRLRAALASPPPPDPEAVSTAPE